MKQNKIKKIAVTGGIGSGKSTVCALIKEKGYKTYSLDEIYADLICGGKLVNELAKEFGKEVINSDGSLNREVLSRIIFGSAEKRKKLNEITHPAIFAEAFRRAESNGGLVFFEVPLLFEGGYQNLFDGVIVVLREETARIKSVSERDGIPPESVKKRINSQFDYNIGDFVKYYVVHNNGKIDDMSDIIDKILLELACKYRN